MAPAELHTIMSGYKWTWRLGLILCAAGIGLSVYAYYVETSKQNDPSFKAACDISSKISCSKVFASKYGKGFGLLEYAVGPNHWLNQPNSVYGIIFYIIQILLSFMHSVNAAFLQIILSVLANFGSVYLAYILYFILEDFCVICVSIYIVNFLLLVITFCNYSFLARRVVNVQKKRQ